MKKLLYMLISMICLPLIGSLFIKPVKSEQEKNDEGPFMVMLYESKGTFAYEPEEAVGGMVAAMVPADFEGMEEPYNIRQEYFKALSVVCRTNLVHEWEQAGKPDCLDIEKCGLTIKKTQANVFVQDEIRQAVNDTRGAVIVDLNSSSNEETVITAPFFTSSDWDILLGEAGEGEGLSLNYAWTLACEEYTFSEILKYFFENIRIVIL